MGVDPRVNQEPVSHGGFEGGGGGFTWGGAMTGLCIKGKPGANIV